MREYERRCRFRVVLKDGGGEVKHAFALLFHSQSADRILRLAVLLQVTTCNFLTFVTAESGRQVDVKKKPETAIHSTYQSSTCPSQGLPFKS